MKRACFPVLVAALLVSGLSVAAEDETTEPKSVGAEDTRECGDFFCKVRLPGPKWAWSDVQHVRNGLYGAQSEDDALVIVTAAKTDAPSVDARFVRRWEGLWLRDCRGVKRSGRFITFQGVPCYELAMNADPGDGSSVLRVFIANGVEYRIRALSEVGAIEARPDFQAIVGCLELTKKPEVAKSGGGSLGVPAWALWAGGGAVALLVLAALFVLRRRNPAGEVLASAAGESAVSPPGPPAASPPPAKDKE